MAKPKRTARSARVKRAAGGGYHHGDLHAALIAAGEAELAENGIEGFTLRGCARRAGVSHAAPAHHFKDVTALLTEIAAIGFERLAETTERFAAKAARGSLEHIVESARGYATFAAENPQHFRLIFRVERLDRSSTRFQAAGRRAFAVPVEAVGAFYGVADPMSDPAMTARVIGLWSTVHGFSDLMLMGQLNRTGVTERMLIDGLLPEIIRKNFARADASVVEARKPVRRRLPAKSAAAK
jgi:AcrR family transcriptional regulator